MKVFFTAAYSGKIISQNYYNAIVNELGLLGVEVISLEKHSYEDFLSKRLIDRIRRETNSEEDFRRELHYFFNKKAIDHSDGVIIEATQQSFKLGYEARMALDFDKMILCLSRDKDYGLDIHDKNLFAKKYSEEGELRKYVQEFVKLINDKKMHVHLHLLLSSKESNFLEWLSSRVKKSKSEVIRDLINEKRQSETEYESDIERVFQK